MRKKHLLKTTFLMLLFAAVNPLGSNAQTAATNQISFNDLSAFKTPPENWTVAGSVKADFNKANTLEKKNGTGILVNVPDKKKNEDLFTSFEHGDIDLSVDFMMPKGSNSGIYLQGRYEIQLLDSWGAEKLSSGDLGGIYQRWDDSKPEGQKGYEGVTPRLNVSRAPGLWQNIRIIFQAPKFDAAGKKTANARVVQIILNGVSIIENAELQGPTRGSAFANEAATGPIRIQGDHGAVAFKNFKYSTEVKTQVTDGSKQREWWQAESPMLATVGAEPALLRSFVDIPGDKRVTHAINVGYPHNVSYSYDLSNGALFQVWKGGFVDATPMWNQRGDGNTTPIGSKLFLNDAPAIAALANDDTAWPDSVAKGSFRSKGYELGDNGYPTFKYTLGGLTVEDKATNEDPKVLTRTLNISGTSTDKLYVRAAAGSDIVDAGNGLYSVNGYEYYVQVAKDAKAVIRTSAKGKELLIPVKDAGKGASVKYSLIW